MRRRGFFNPLFRFSVMVSVLWLLGGTAFIYVWLPLYVRGEVVKVSDFSKLSLREAKTLARKMGLAVGRVERRADNNIRRGSVIAHLPAPGQRVKENRPITFIVSTGPETIEVPDLAGKSLREAEYELTLANLQLGARVYIHSDEFPMPDVVITSAPSPQALIARGDAVHLLVSRGPRSVEVLMPRLVGMRYEEAQNLLNSYRLGISDTTYRLESRSEPGIVLAQYPEPDTPIPSGERVTLTVNRQRARDTANARTVIIEHQVRGNPDEEVRVKIVVQDEEGSHELVNGFVSGGRRISQPRAVIGKATLYVYERDMETPIRKRELR